MPALTNLATMLAGTFAATWQAPAMDVNLAGLLKTADACSCGQSMPLGVRMGLRSRNRPVLEGRWSCSTRCLEARVASIIKREMQPGRGPRTHRHRIPLGLLLLSNGSVTQQQLRAALDAMGADDGDRIGDVLRRECGLSERKLAEALATQWGASLWDVSSLQTHEAAALAPGPILECCSMVPFAVPVAGQRSRRLAATFQHSVDARGIFALRHIHDMPVDAGIAPATGWQKSYKGILAASLETHEIQCDDAEDMRREVAKMLQRAQPVEARWVRVHELFWLRMWLEPAALAGGPSQVEDVADVIFRVPAGAHTLPQDRLHS